MGVMRSLLPLACLLPCLLSFGCSPSMAEMRGEGELPEMPPLPPPDPEDTGQSSTAGGEQPPQPAVASTARAAPGEVEPASAAPQMPPLPTTQDGGDIPRTTLAAVLDAGIGRFLQQVQTEPHLEQGRFVGWRLLTPIPPEGGALRPGDTVVRVNGQSIERPEQFKNVWDSMATSSELVLDVLRGEHRGQVRYEIVD
jgi:hypothetical protein